MRKKYYLVLDTETATMPFADELCSNAEQKQKIAIAKPLVYDIGWTIIDRLGNVQKRVNYLVQETFFVPNVFKTAYYSAKRPIYMEMLKNGEISTKNWNDIATELKADLETVDISSAYNACFDFKKAIPFTERYIYHLYNDDYISWEKGQKAHCRKMLNGCKDDDEKNPDFLKPIFKFRFGEYPIADLWTIACDRLINIEKYKAFCMENSLVTNSVKYFKTSAETSYQYLMKNYDFTEHHTALSDAEIESEILVKALRKGKVEPIIKAFPFRELGTTIQYVEEKPKFRDTLKSLFAEYIETNNGELKAESGNKYWKGILNSYNNL